MLEELIDRFGEPPKAVENLLRIACLKARAHDVFVREVVQKGDELKLTMYERAGIDPVRIPGLVESMAPALLFTADAKAPYFTYRMCVNSREKGYDVLERLDMLLKEMERLLPDVDKKDEMG